MWHNSFIHSPADGISLFHLEVIMNSALRYPELPKYRGFAQVHIPRSGTAESSKNAQ